MGLLRGFGLRPKQRPRGDLELFFDENVMLGEGASSTPLVLHQRYKAWRKSGMPALDTRTFDARFEKVCPKSVQRTKAAGRIRYIGICLIE